jgi:O-antigen ligase
VFPFLLAGGVLILLALVALSVPLDRIAYVATGVFVLFVTWNGLRGTGGAFGNVFLVLAFGAVAAQAYFGRRSVPLPGWLFAASAGFVLAGMLNVIFPPDSSWLDRTLISYRVDFKPPPPGFAIPRSNLAELVKFQIGMVLIPVMIAFVATTPARVHRLIDLFVIGASINAAVAMVDFMGIPLSPAEVGAGRNAGLTIHPNYLGLTCAIAIPLALLWVSRGGRWRILGLVATFVLLGGEYVSGSRAGAVSAALAVVVTVAALPRLRRGLGVVLPVTGVILVSALAFTPAGDQLLEQLRFQGSASATGSNSARADLANLAIDQFQARPIQGVGFGVIADAHNIYLQLLAAGGVIALAAFLTFVAGLWASLRRAVLYRPLRDAATAAGVAIGIWLTNGIFDSQLADKYLFIVPGLLLAMACLAGARVKAPERQAPPAVRDVTPTEPSLVGAR